MAIDWTTFLLEIVNFLVLVWLLQRFLYRPVLAVLDKRRQAIADERAHADAKVAEAQALKADYEARMVAWETELSSRRQALAGELESARDRGLADIRQTLADEMAAARSRAERAEAAQAEQIERRARAEAFAAAARLLERLSSPEITRLAAGVFVEDLKSLPPEAAGGIRAAAARLGPEERVTVDSAHALAEDDQRMLTAALALAGGRDIAPSFRVVPALLAGIKVHLGEYELAADIAGAFAGLAERPDHG